MTNSTHAVDRSIVIPVYRNEATIAPLVAELSALCSGSPARTEVVFVVDGSPDGCLGLLREKLAEQAFPSQLIALSRNFGAFAAIRAGLAAADGPLVAVMAADLQEPPELVTRAFDALAAEDCDVVFGQRMARSDPWPGRLMSAAFWALYRRFVQPEVPPGGVDVFACNERVRQALLALRESRSSLVAQLFWLGYRRKLIPYGRRPRADGGESSWTFSKRWRYMTDSIFAFTQLPIAVLRRLGLVGLLVSAGASVIVAAAWWLGEIPVSGYTPIMLFIGVTSSIQLLALGVVGEYVWRAYENTKHRPEAVIAEHVTFSGLDR